jgi:hypothetical protein
MIARCSVVAGVLFTACGGSGSSASIPGCDHDVVGAFDLGADTTVRVVKGFRAGAPLSLADSPRADAPRAGADVCLVKLLVGPGRPGPADSPSSSDGIGIEIWLPVRWNGRYQAVGGGGLVGGTEFVSRTAIASLNRGWTAGVDVVSPTEDGFVTSANDTGHTREDFSFAMNPDGTLNDTLLFDFADRATHVTALETKLVIEAFYGRPATFSYFNGCSTGGGQALMEAQRHPEDFDGVLAGAPSVQWDRAEVAGLWPQLVMLKELGAPMSTDKLALATAAANAACGHMLAGESDGYINDPSSCQYDPASDPAVLCQTAGGDNKTSACLSLVEAKVINMIWYGPTTNGRVPSPSQDNGFAPRGDLASGQLWFGLARGARLSGHPFWDGLAGAAVISEYPAWVALVMGDATYADPTFENETGHGEDRWRTLDYSDLPNLFSASTARFADLLAIAQADLSAFRARGNKLLMWHGLADSLVFPQGSIRYYEAVSAAAGGYAEAGGFARLFLAPGIDHCGAGGVEGTDPPPISSSSLMPALQAWVEQGVSPDNVTAGNRPFCPYPQRLQVVNGAFSCVWSSPPS